MGLGNPVDNGSWTQLGGHFAGRTDYLWQGASHDTTSWGSNRGFHRLSSGGGFGTISGADGRGMWNAQFDTSLNADGWDYFRMRYVIDMTVAGSEVVNIYQYDPLSGDAGDVQVGFFDLSGTNKPSAGNGFNQLRWENFGSTIPDYWIDDVVVSYIPEPATLSLLALGALAVMRRRR
jgi:hypothetical protein